MKKNFDRAGPDAVRLLRTYRPCTGGNATLRALHDLDVQDKHQAFIPAISTAPMPATHAASLQWGLLRCRLHG